jgi:hypothetical protein
MASAGFRRLKLRGLFLRHSDGKVLRIWRCEIAAAGSAAHFLRNESRRYPLIFLK